MTLEYVAEKFKDLHYTLLLLIQDTKKLSLDGTTGFTLHFATINTLFTCTNVFSQAYLHYTLLLLILFRFYQIQ